MLLVPTYALLMRSAAYDLFIINVRNFLDDMIPPTRAQFRAQACLSHRAAPLTRSDIV